VATIATVEKRVRRKRPFVFGKVFRFVLRDFLASAWPLVLVAVLVAVHVFLYTGTPTRRHFFGVQYTTTILMSALASAAFFGRAGRAEMYPILARPVPRATLTFALIMGASLVAVGVHLIGSAAVLVRYGPWLAPQQPVTGWLDFLAFGQGSLPVVLVALLVVSGAALLSHFIASTAVRLVTLALVALLVMAFDSRNFPIEGLKDILGQLPPIIAPVTGALRFATEPSPDLATTYSLVALLAYALALTLSVVAISAGKETVLD
jgi:hypothetical protein